MKILEEFSLQDRVAIVTGASSGLGVEFAIGLAEAGADLVLGARRVDRLQATVAEVEKRGRRAVAVKADVAKPEAGEDLARAAIENFGRLDILVNNAGIGTAVPALRETPEQFRQVIDVNLSGSYWVAQAAARTMKEGGGGSIINISSVIGLASGGLPQAAYSASKAGVIGLTRDLAQQWTGRINVRVNAIAPGFFVSEMTDQFPDGYFEERAKQVPAGRPGRGRELAAAVVFLASDASSFITGITLPVDGGFLIG